jgi:hypothetical protein
MTGNDRKKQPRFDTIGELVEHFDNHDLGEELEEMEEVGFEVDLRHKQHVFTLDTELATKITRIARSRHVSTDELIHAWLQEKVVEEA